MSTSAELHQSSGSVTYATAHSHQSRRTTLSVVFSRSKDLFDWIKATEMYQVSSRLANPFLNA